MLKVLARVAMFDLKAWLDGLFFSGAFGNSRQRNTTSATAGDPQTAARQTDDISGIK